MIKALSQQCDAGYHFSEAFGGCVLDDPDIIVPVPGTAPPATASSNFLMYAGIGLGLILLLGAFAGGLLVSVAESMGAVFLAPSLKELVSFTLLIAILLVRPAGLFGRPVV